MDIDTGISMSNGTIVFKDIHQDCDYPKWIPTFNELKNWSLRHELKSRMIRNTTKDKLDKSLIDSLCELRIVRDEEIVYDENNNHFDELNSETSYDGDDEGELILNMFAVYNEAKSPDNLYRSRMKQYAIYVPCWYIFMANLGFSDIQMLRCLHIDTDNQPEYIDNKEVIRFIGSDEMMHQFGFIRNTESWNYKYMDYDNYPGLWGADRKKFSTSKHLLNETVEYPENMYNDIDINHVDCKRARSYLATLYKLAQKHYLNKILDGISIMAENDSGSKIVAYSMTLDQENEAIKAIYELVLCILNYTKTVISKRTMQWLLNLLNGGTSPGNVMGRGVQFLNAIFWNKKQLIDQCDIDLINNIQSTVEFGLEGNSHARHHGKCISKDGKTIAHQVPVILTCPTSYTYCSNRYCSTCGKDICICICTKCFLPKMNNGCKCVKKLIS